MGCAAQHALHRGRRILQIFLLCALRFFFLPAHTTPVARAGRRSGASARALPRSGQRARVAAAVGWVQQKTQRRESRVRAIARGTWMTDLVLRRSRSHAHRPLHLDKGPTTSTTCRLLSRGRRRPKACRLRGDTRMAHGAREVDFVGHVRRSRTPCRELLCASFRGVCARESRAAGSQKGKQP